MAPPEIPSQPAASDAGPEWPAYRVLLAIVAGIAGLIALYVVFLVIGLISMGISAGMAGGYRSDRWWLAVPVISVVGFAASVAALPAQARTRRRVTVLAVAQVLLLATAFLLARSATPPPPSPGGLSRFDAISPARMIWLLAWLELGGVAVTVILTRLTLRPRARVGSVVAIVVGFMVVCAPPATVMECRIPIYDEVVGEPLPSGFTVVSDSTSSFHRATRVVEVTGDGSVGDQIDALARHYRGRGWDLEQRGWSEPYSYHASDGDWVLNISSTPAQLDGPPNEGSSDVTVMIDRLLPDCF